MRIFGQYEWIYECVNKLDNESPRFVLGEVSDKTKKPLICFGINPSTAVPDDLDRTLSRVKNESIRRDFDGWIMFNIYPQRATNPKNMDSKINIKIYNSNKQHIRDVIGRYSNLTVWAAWGSNIEQREYLKDCLREITTVIPKSAKWVNMGNLVGKKNHPHHPLYLKRNLPFNQFHINEYLKNLDSK